MKVSKIKREFIIRYFLFYMIFIFCSIFCYFMVNIYLPILIICLYLNRIIFGLIDTVKLYKILDGKEIIENIVFNYDNSLIFTSDYVYSVRNRVFKLTYEEIESIRIIKYKNSFGYCSTPFVSKIVFCTKDRRYNVYTWGITGPVTTLNNEDNEYVFRIVKKYNSNTKLHIYRGFWERLKELFDSEH